ncbi:hypothetical protein EMCG_08700, partial [[Emmonsia] crescens]
MHRQAMHQYYNLYNSMPNFVVPGHSHCDPIQATPHHLPNRVRDDHGLCATECLSFAGIIGAYLGME